MASLELSGKEVEGLVDTTEVKLPQEEMASSMRSLFRLGSSAQSPCF